jgi:hypothetical protein
MLEWSGADDLGVLRAYDDVATDVIWRDGAGHFRVGSFPAPGPECPWEESLKPLGEAIASAARCAEHVRELRTLH